MACQHEEMCVIDDDPSTIYAEVKKADANVIASAVYYGSATALLQALMERTGEIVDHNGRLFVAFLAKKSKT